MTYMVLELQTTPDGAVANIITQHDTREEAESKYHTVLAAAAISALPLHAAVLMTSEGVTLENRYYEREA